LRRQSAQAEEFDHWLLNSISMIASLLSAQSRLVSPDAAAQLMIAVNRVAPFGHVHRQLHLLDHQEHVQFKQFPSIFVTTFPACCFAGRLITLLLLKAPAAEFRRRSAALLASLSAS
jgi:two-component sensor histidine kinase